MATTAELLLQLQGIDYQLGELERSKGYLPDMIDSLKAEIESADEEFANTNKRRKKKSQENY